MATHHTVWYRLLLMFDTHKKGEIAQLQVQLASATIVWAQNIGE